MRGFPHVRPPNLGRKPRRGFDARPLIRSSANWVVVMNRPSGLRMPACARGPALRSVKSHEPRVRSDLDRDGAITADRKPGQHVDPLLLRSPPCRNPRRHFVAAFVLPHAGSGGKEMAGNPATSLSISAGERSEVTFRETPRSSASLLDEPLTPSPALGLRRCRVSECRFWRSFVILNVGLRVAECRFWRSFPGDVQGTWK